MSLAFGFALPHWQPLSGGFSPASLFAGGTAGAWYDPSDLSTLFTTSVGTTPVAMPGQGSAVSVGLMLDKSQGAIPGSELVTNGNFSSGTTGWSITGAWAVVGGQFVKTGASTATASQSILTVGRWYTFSINVVAVSGTLYVYAGSGNARQITALGVQTFTLLCSGDANLYVQCIGTDTATVDNISVRELPGNHAIAFNNTTARPELRARVNLLTYSEEFDNGAWFKVGGAVSANTTVAPDGTTTADTFTASNTYLRHAVLSNAGTGIAIVANTSVVFSAYIRKGNYNFVSMLVTNNITTWFVATFDFSGATPVVSKTGNGAGGTFTSASVEAANNGFWRLTIRGSTTDAAVIGEIALNSSATPTYGGYGEELWTAAGTETVIAWGADLRPANIGANVPAYQRIADANTYDTSGFPLYLRFDGIDDSMYTPANLNLSGTDKVAVFAGVRKLSDAAAGMVSELSANYNNNAGTFTFAASSNGMTTTNQYASSSRGSASANSNQYGISAAAPAPVTNVVTNQFDIANDLSAIRLNGAASGTNATGDQGSGNYGTYPLFIGARNNSSLWFNGHLYSLAVVGSAVSAGNISATEQWVAQKTGLVIP